VARDEQARAITTVRAISGGPKDRGAGDAHEVAVRDERFAIERATIRMHLRKVRVDRCGAVRDRHHGLWLLEIELDRCAEGELHPGGIVAEAEGADEDECTARLLAPMDDMVPQVDAAGDRRRGERIQRFEERRVPRWRYLLEHRVPLLDDPELECGDVQRRARARHVVRRDDAQIETDLRRSRCVL
jgi:hypothetical protein